MAKLLKNLFKYLFLIALGGSIYCGIEVLYRGYSHRSMFLVGGICFLLIGLINEVLEWDMWFEQQIFIGLTSVLTIEFLAGCIVNLWLGLNVWDYSNLPMNLLGQICLPFALLWIPIICIAILLDDCIRYGFFNEEKPKYKSYVKNIIFRR